ncbi:MAG: cyclopropane fatty acyl phospholipid synthase [Woeseia sp.]
MNATPMHAVEPLQGASARLLQKLLADCDVELNGSRPFDIQVADARALNRMVRRGSLGLGESYMDGQWECERVDELVDRLLRHSLYQRFANTGAQRWLALVSRLRNLQSRARAGIVGERHYDIGNELYEKMLDSHMNYSCACWETAETLEDAQRDKMELICRKLELEPGMTVLDIGCGWGGMARYAAERFGVQVLGITISKEQQSWAEARIDSLPIEIRCQDYRDVRGEFDRVFSIGMFEHVGYKNYRGFFRKCREVLRPDGLLLLHTIGSNSSVQSTDPWLHRYIFPNSMLPSIPQIGRALEPHFVMEDWHSFGPHYDRTLLAWHRRVNAAWEALGDRYDKRFRRMWNFYLLACAGAFRARNVQLWQIVLANGRRSAGYKRPMLTGTGNDRNTEQEISGNELYGGRK